MHQKYWMLNYQAPLIRVEYQLAHLYITNASLDLLIKEGPVSDAELVEHLELPD